MVHKHGFCSTHKCTNVYSYFTPFNPLFWYVQRSNFPTCFAPIWPMISTGGPSMPAVPEPLRCSTSHGPRSRESHSRGEAVTLQPVVVLACAVVT